MERRDRIDIIDAARGLSILLMVLYHLFYDLVAFCSFPAHVLFNPLVNSLQVLFASLFILMSGASTQFSRNNLKRAVKMLLAALAVSVVTWLFDPSEFVRFGILHFLGVSALLYALFYTQIDRLVSKVHPVFFIVLFFVFRSFLNHSYPIEHLWVLGIYARSFVSSDYFPIFPWIFIYFFGIRFGKAVLARKLPGWFYEFKFPFLAAAGRKTLWIYLLHQPMLMGVIELIRIFR